MLFRSAVVSSNPATNTDLVNGDYATFGETRFATDITYANFSIGAYNTFSLNGDGIAAISKTGISKFGFRSDYDLDNVVPTPNSAKTNYTTAYTADQIGVTQDPKLVVTYGSAVAVNSNFFLLF